MRIKKDNFVLFKGESFFFFR